MTNMHISIHRCLLKLDCSTYADIVSAYFTSRLIISYSHNQNYESIVRDSPDFARITQTYRQVISSALTNENLPIWYDFCRCLQATNLDVDHISFLEAFLPYAVLDWNYFNYFSSNEIGNMLVALILILRCPQAPQSTTAQTTLLDAYNLNRSLYHRCGLDYTTFERCWRAVFIYPLLSSQVNRNSTIARAVKIYHQLYLPASDLLHDYASLVLSCKNVATYKQAIQGNRRKAIDKPTLEHTRSQIDQQLEAALVALQQENPTDVIRGVSYVGRNDASYECTYILDRFRRTISPTTRNLIINPSPDFLLYWAKTESAATFFVPDKTIALLYTQQFPNLCFLDSTSSPSIINYNRILVLGRDLLFDNYAYWLNCVSSDAIIYALIPETDLRPFRLVLDSLKNPLFIRQVVHLPSVLFESSPKRKILLTACDSEATEFQLLFGFCDGEKTQFCVEKKHYDIPYVWFDQTTSLTDARNNYTRHCTHITKQVSSPKIYSFSLEVKLYYTIQMNCKNRIAARVCYRAILRDGQKHRKRGNRKTKLIETGLRHQTMGEVLNALELAALNDSIAPAVVEDILDYYSDISALSLKTAWLCLRDELSTKSTYKEDVAIELFCGPEQALSVLCIGNSTFNDYEIAMQSVFSKADHIRQKHWDMLYLILSIAVKNKYILFNPLAEAMPFVIAKNSDRQKRSRNTLVKRTLEFDEEQRMIDYLLEPSSESLNNSNVRRFQCGNGWAAALLHMFTPLSLREICALRWEAFQQIGGLPTYQIIVHTYLTDTGKVKNTIDQALEKSRSVPVAPILASLLLAYKAFIAARYNLTDDLIALWPIVLDSFSAEKNHHIPQLCSVKTAAARCKELISVADIQSNEIVLPDAIYGNYVTDLNAYQGDLLHTNIKFHLRHVCKLTAAETCYLLGRKASTTLAQHYVEHNTPIHQHRMALKQERWIARHIHTNPSPTRVTSDSIIDHAWEHNFHSHSAEIPSISVSIVPNSGQVLPAMDIEINSQHGVDGHIIICSEELK